MLVTLSEAIAFLRFCWKMILSFGGSAHVPVIRLSVSTLKSDEQSLPKTLQGSHCTDEAGVWEKAKTETQFSIILSILLLESVGSLDQKVKRKARVIRRNAWSVTCKQGPGPRLRLKHFSGFSLLHYRIDGNAMRPARDLALRERTRPRGTYHQD